MKKENCIRLLIQTIFALTFVSMVSCGSNIDKNDSSVYLKDANVLYKGSVYYNQAGCASCHGTSMKGDGPDASGASIPDLTQATEPEKTHLDYFKSLSSSPAHAGFQGWTDRGRWAMAHYLYSKSAGIKKGHSALNIRLAALKQADIEIKEAYKTQRRWFMGAKPLGQRPGPEHNDLKLENLMQGVQVDKESSLKPVSKKKNDKNDSVYLTRGHNLYQNNCAQCHGIHGEGSSSSFVIGPTGLCKERGRQCITYLSASSVQKNLNKVPHKESGLNLPSFSSFTQNDWQQINQYLATMSD